MRIFDKLRKDKRKGTTTIVNIIPIEQRLSIIDKNNKTRNSILELIHSNVVHNRKYEPWKEANWKSAKVTAQHIEELGLLARLNEIEIADSTKEAVKLVSELMGYYDDNQLENRLGDYYELFLSETAICLIYLLEYFFDFLSAKQKSIFNKHLCFISDTLWELICDSSVYDERTQSRLAWNHSQFVHAVSGLCAIKIDNQDSEERISRAILWNEGYMSQSFTWDGFSREGVFYAGVTRMPLLLFLMALKEHKSIDLLHHSAMINHSQYLINEWVPDSALFITRNDMFHVRHSTTLSSLLIYAHLYQCKKSLALWEAVVGENGIKTYGNPNSEGNRNGSLVLNYLFYPEELTPLKSLDCYIDSFKVYREAGVVVGYSPKLAFKYSFQASSYYGDIHSQSDHGQIYLYLNGDTLLGDAAVGNRRQPDTPGQSEGHNSLMIDGVGMSLSGAGWQTCSILEDATCHGEYQLMRANLTPAYNAYHSRTTLSCYKRLVIVHTKEPYYLVVLDSVSDFHDLEHEYAYRFHTDPKNTISLEQGNIVIDSERSKLQIIPIGIEWKPDKNMSFVFNNENRSTYVDSKFTAKNYLGGYILIPSPNNEPVNVIKKNNQLTLQSGFYQSTITFHLDLVNIHKDILTCESFRVGHKEETLRTVKVMREESGCKTNDFDYLTGDIICEINK